MPRTANLPAPLLVGLDEKEHTPTLQRDSSDGAIRSLSNPPLRPSEWKVVCGRLIHKSERAPHERSVSARYDLAEASHKILPRFANESHDSPIRRKLHIHADEIAHDPPPMATLTRPHKPAHHIADHVARSQMLADLPASAAFSASSPILDRAGSASLELLELPNRSPHHKDALPSPLDAEKFALQRPTNRSEAVQLAENLDRQLDEHQGDFRAIDRVWKITFCELVRQVYVHCTERGVLLDRVRRWSELELKRVAALAKDGSERERRLRENLREKHGLSVAELDSSDAGCLAMGSQRLELVQTIRAAHSKSG